MAKLSQQIPQTKPYYSRTERLKVLQAQRREGINQQQFIELQKQAEQLQQTEFSNIASVEEYAQKYNRLSPALRQFFIPPEQLEAQRQTSLNTAKNDLQKEIADAQRKKDEAYQKYQERVQNERERWQSHNAEYRSNPKNRERYEKRLDYYEEQYEEKQTYYQTYVDKLNEGFNELNSGKNLTLNAIKEYADDNADYQVRKQEARDKDRKAQQEQLAKIEQLKTEGYKPMIIEQYSQTGKLEKVDVELYKEGAGYVNVSTYKPTQNVSKLEKSEISQATIPLIFDVGKQKVTFKTTTELYKDKEGKLYTPYGAVGKTEGEVIKEAQDIAYNEWQTERATKQQLPETVAVTPEKQKGFIGRTWEKVKTGVGNINVGLISGAGGSIELKDAVNLTKTVYNEIPDAELYANIPTPLGLNLDTGIISPIKSDTGISLKELKGLAVEKIGSAKTNVVNWVLGKENIEKLPEEESLKAVSEEYQLRFEDQYMKKLIYGETTFETASKEFEEGDVAKQLQKNYENLYLQEYAELRAETPSSLKKTAGTIAVGGLGFTENILGLTPTTVKSTVVTAGALYGGYSVLKAIPPSIIYGTTGVTTVAGAVKWRDPTSTIEEAGSGAFATVVGASILSYGAYKYLRSPVVTRTEIKPPKTSLKTQAIGKEAIKYNIRYENQIRQLEKVTFGRQKLSQQAISGYRTVVSTKGRVLLNKFLNYRMTGLKVGNLYEGVPFADPKGYAKALGRLKSYGYSEYQARATLRYSAPQIIDQRLLSGEILVSPQQARAVGKFTYETTRPVYTVDKNLGIKTRGGRTVVDQYTVDRTLTQQIAVVNKEVVNYDVVNQIITRTRTPAQLGKTTTTFTQKGIVKAGDVGKLYTRLDIKDLERGFTYTTKTPYQIQNLYERFYQQQTLPLKRKVTTGSGRTTIIKSELTQDVNLDKLIEQMRGYKVTKIPVAKPVTPTRTIAQMSNAELKNMIRDIKNIYKPTKLERWSAKQMKAYQQTLPPPTQSANQQLVSELKSAYIPPEVTTSVKSAILTKQLTFLGTGSKSLSALNLGVKTRSNVKSEVMLKNLLREDLKLELGQKTVLRQETGLRQTPSLQSALKLDTGLDLGLNLNQLQTTYTPKPTTFKPFPLLNLELKEKMKKKSKKKRGDYWLLGSLPDFTARSVGLPSPEINIKDIEKELRTIKTGGEIRRGVKLKWQ